jgi:hypothetical protein
MNWERGHVAKGVKVTGVREVNAVLDQIASVHLNTARKELRDGSQAIARDTLIPILKRGAAASGVPIAAAMADTARARKDRIVFVQVGAVNPKLSGFRSGRGRVNYKTTLALGSNYGPTDPDRNHYAVPRNQSGHWVQPTVNADGTYQRVKDEYRALLVDILSKYSSSAALGRSFR